MDHSTIGERLKAVRIRLGLTQKELSRGAGVSLSLVKKLEEGQVDHVRTETLRKLAGGLHVHTTTLMTAPPAEDEPIRDAALWAPVRAALYRPGPQPEQEPTVAGVGEAVAAAMPLFDANRYGDIVSVLPGLLRDAAALESEGRKIRAYLYRMTGWALTHAGEYSAAEVALRMAMDDAASGMEVASIARIRCWLLLHTGRMTECWETGIRVAADTEPRFSSASPAELSAWGWLHLHNSGAATRDNRPGDAEDTMRSAAAAAARIGREYKHPVDFLATFGPVTVAMKDAEHYMVEDKPDKVLALAAAIEPDAWAATRNNRNRHLLDVAAAHARMKGGRPKAFKVLEQLRADAPQWLANQREARQIMADFTRSRTTLTPEMREMADAVRLPL